MIPKEQRCEEQIRSEWSRLGAKGCSHARKLEHEGLWYCGQHYPPTVAVKRAEAHAVWRARNVARMRPTAANRRRLAEQRACAGITTEALEAGLDVLHRDPKLVRFETALDRLTSIGFDVRLCLDPPTLRWRAIPYACGQEYPWGDGGDDADEPLEALEETLVILEAHL